MSDHTPGPWRVNETMSRAHHRYEDGTRVVSSAEGDIAICETTRGWEEPGTSPANAQLIAAAPDLLGALRFILAFYEPGQKALDTEAWKRAEAAGRAAVAKAERK